MNRFSIEAAAITHVGISGNNEDNYYVNGSYKSDTNVGTDGIADKKQRNSYTYAVFDGTGGEGHGELASLIAAATLGKYKETDIRQTLRSYIKTVSEFISDLIRKDRAVISGTTLALLNIRNNTAIACNIGSSRVYLCRKGLLYLLTGNYAGRGKKEDSRLIPSDINISPYVSKEIKAKKGDVFMLCTAGFSNVVSYDEIAELLSAENSSVTSMTKKLVAVSQDKNNDDDVTVIVARLV